MISNEKQQDTHIHRPGGKKPGISVWADLFLHVNKRFNYELCTAVCVECGRRIRVDNKFQKKLFVAVLIFGLVFYMVADLLSQSIHRTGDYSIPLEIVIIILSWLPVSLCAGFAYRAILAYLLTKCEWVICDAPEDDIWLPEFGKDINKSAAIAFGIAICISAIVF